jgi:hypothetical protein
MARRESSSSFVPPAGGIGQDLQQKLAAFRTEIAKNRLVQLWSSREELKSKVIISLHKAMSEYPAVGWMRASAAASEDLLSQINQLRLENNELRSKAITPFDGAEQLADMDATFTIHYRHDEYNPSLGVSRTVAATLSIDWKRLFILLAPQFSEPRSYIIQSKLATALKEKGLIPKGREHIDFYDTDISTIEAQFIAYRFISAEMSDNPSGHVSRFLCLTHLGQKRYLEWVTIKTEGNDA